MNAKLWSDLKSRRDSVYVPERRERQRHIRANGGRVEGVKEAVAVPRPMRAHELKKPGIIGRVFAKFMRQKTG